MQQSGGHNEYIWEWQIRARSYILWSGTSYFITFVHAMEGVHWHTRCLWKRWYRAASRNQSTSSSFSCSIKVSPYKIFHTIHKYWNARLTEKFLAEIGKRWNGNKDVEVPNFLQQFSCKVVFFQRFSRRNIFFKWKFGVLEKRRDSGKVACCAKTKLWIFSERFFREKIQKVLLPEN